MVKSESKSNLKLSTVVWLCRIIVGLTFILSGWSKSIDPWGFLYKLEEYFNVWHLELPREITLTFGLGLSIAEFTIGILILVGAMRYAAVWLSAAFMAVMLPLTVYIAIADPVSDCGCFGELFILSNWATLLKNILLTALIIVLLKHNNRVGSIYSDRVQWLVAVGTLIYAFSLAFVGYRYQPLVDFRPFKVGEILNEDSGDDDTLLYIERIVAFDGDDDVTDDVFDGDGEQFILAITDPGIHYLTRARLANELNDFIISRGGRMIALVAADGSRLDDWKQLALPSFDVYSADDTELKELVRGDAGLVYLRDGKIIWKRNISSLSHDMIKELKTYDDIDSLGDNGNLYVYLTSAFLIWLLLLCCFKKNSYLCKSNNQ